MVVKDDILLHKRVVRGDVVTISHDFVRRSSGGATTATNQYDTAALSTHGLPPHHSSISEDYDESSQESATGLPSNPIVYRIREDLSWDDVVCNSSPSAARQFLNGSYYF